MSTISNQILSDIIVHNKYARWIKELGRRETWEELCERNMAMHIKKFPKMEKEIRNVYEKYVLPKKILPSMRSMQFAGQAIIRNPSRIYNCAYLPIEHPDAFSELMFLLLGGTGVGYSVQYRHVNLLPKVLGPSLEERRYVIGDSIEGWADSVKILMEAYFLGKARPRFDYSDIRDKGTELVVSGGKAPGPDPLRICLAHIERLLRASVGRRIQPIEVHDICCHIADAVLAGGIRRAAMIALFSADDVDMMTCKAGMWWEENPQRGRANNSVILHRKTTSKREFMKVWERIQYSGAGEPGIYWTNNYDWGTNPCCEIALRPYTFCNLTEVDVSDIDETNVEEFKNRCGGAAFLGTLQASYTDFHYLRPVWKQHTEEDALIGVGLTGIASAKISSDVLKDTVAHIEFINRFVANAIDINPAKRLTTVKPAGTSSIVLGSSSGIHAWHSPYYIRRIRLGKDEALYQYLVKELPEFVEDDYEKPNQAVVSIPQEAPKNAKYRTESAEDLFRRAIFYNEHYVQVGSLDGANSNNVSCTISVRDDEWKSLADLFWTHRSLYNGMSVLPYDGGTYKQAPFEQIDEKTFKKLEKQLHSIDLTQVIEVEDNTALQGELACAGGVCEIV